MGELRKDMSSDMRILVADDDGAILELLSIALEVLGFNSVTLAHDGAEALDIIRSSEAEFDCFLLDIQMPKMDGIELCASIRARPEYRSTPVVMLTAMSDRKYIERSLAAGATDYVTKPFEIMDLKARLNSATQAYNLAKEGREMNERLHALADDLIQQKGVELGDTFDIEDVPGYLNCEKFKGLVTDFGECGVKHAAFVVLQIDDVASIYNACGPAGYFNFICDVSDAISDVITQDGYLFSYVGNGAFVVFDPRSRQGIEMSELGADIEESAAAMGLVFSDGTPIPIRLQQSEAFGFNDVSMRSPEDLVRVSRVQSTKSYGAPFVGQVV
ncbi:response regulator [Nioella ostreopsis]|uniref:response regulator n=1 Tax=Nioella ostreopsis TaxID=2448479 RepID=UPI0013DF3772|nr:response regulator [Nioella ostreopsis]